MEKPSRPEVKGPCERCFYALYHLRKDGVTPPLDCPARGMYVDCKPLSRQGALCALCLPCTS